MSKYNEKNTFIIISFSLSLLLLLLIYPSLADSGWGLCVENYSRNCADLYADRGRVCGEPPLLIPCGDIVVSEVPYNDIRLAPPQAQGVTINGYGDISFPSRVLVQIITFRCDEEEGCIGAGVLKAYCYNRVAAGPPCAGS